MRGIIHKLLLKITPQGELELRERLFRLILAVGLAVSLVAVLEGLLLENAAANTILMGSLFIIILAAGMVTLKCRKTDFAVMLFAILVICVIFPVMFFVSGGIAGGASVWFVLGILYIFLMFRDRKLFVFLALAVIVDSAAYVAAYLYPGMVDPLGSPAQVYYDSLFAVLAAGIAVGVIMRFQIRLFERERELTLRQKEEIEKIIKSKDAFFTNMSHELRTPINTIIGLNEMILREDISDEVAEDAMNVKNAGKMLLALVNDILDFSQIESGQMAIVPAEYRTEELFGEVVELIQPRIKEKGLDFYIDIDKSIPSVLFGDDVRIKQVLVNILTNAVKYTQKGCITLSVQGEMAGDGIERLTVSVSDTGIGIRKEDLDSLYDYFKRIDKERNRKVEGSGLGLAITKQLVSLMGGKITIDSIYKKGSVFTVVLEQKAVSMEPIGRMDYLEKLRSAGWGYYKQSFEAPKAKILIVDDNEANLLVTKKLLRATKVLADTAHNGAECLEWTKKKSYHVILLDGLMPEMDGMETLQAIRSQENGLCRKTPVIVLTANAAPGDEKRYLENGFDGYLAKPVDSSRMEAEILKFLPAELIEYQMDAGQCGMAVSKAQVVQRKKRRKIQISTDCVSDLSEEYIKRFGLKIMYQYIETDRGCFRDTKEISVDNLSRHLKGDTAKVRTVSASVGEYENFYAQALAEAEEVIHISMAGNLGKSYANAAAAAECFDNVHVVDSGLISCGQGLLVLIAADMLCDGSRCAADICKELNRAKVYIKSNFLLPGIQYFYASGYVNKVTASLFERFSLHPELQVRKSCLKISGFLPGKLEDAKKRYIKDGLRKKNQIDKRVVFIIHAGCSVKEQREFVDEVLKYVPFEKVIIQKVSVSCASCAGPGTIGLAYLLKLGGEPYDNKNK